MKHVFAILICFVYIKSSDILYTPFGYFDSDEVFHPTYWGAGNLENSTNNFFLYTLGRKFEYNGIIYYMLSSEKYRY